MFAFRRICKHADNADTHIGRQWPDFPNVELLAASATKQVLAIFRPLQVLNTSRMAPQCSSTVQFTIDILEDLDIGIFRTSRDELTAGSLSYSHSFDFAAVAT
jgi:hypothetical protein